MSNIRYKNAFINAINLIALTIISDYDWKNPWEDFTEQGNISFGQTVREMITDLVEAQDYNEHMNSATDFLKTEIPDVYSYLHELNFQKFYKVTVNDQEIGLAFTESEGVYNLVMSIIGKLRLSYIYDRYLIDKYQLCRRIVDGTVPSVQIANFDTNTPRQNVSFMKEYSNNMIFMSPNYNPAGIRKATMFENQRTIISTGLEAQISTEVLATSYFKDEAEMRTKMSMIDTFHLSDYERLAKLLGDAYVPFTSGELAKLQNVVACIIADDFFKDFYYALDSQSETLQTEFTNPETLMRNVWLHAWRIFSTSPFANCIVFTKDASSVTGVEVSPSTATVTKGQNLQLASLVSTQGITNKSVMWGVDSASETKGATINQKGLLEIPSNYDNTGSGTAGVYDIEIETILETGDKLTVNGVTYTVGAEDDTIAKQITALKSALNVATITDDFTVGGTQPHCTLTEKSGKYGILPVPVVTLEKAQGSSGAIDFSNTTEGAHAGNIVVVTATSIFDKTKSGTAIITVA